MEFNFVFTCRQEKRLYRFLDEAQGLENALAYGLFCKGLLAFMESPQIYTKNLMNYRIKKGNEDLSLLINIDDRIIKHLNDLTLYIRNLNVESFIRKTIRFELDQFLDDFSGAPNSHRNEMLQSITRKNIDETTILNLIHMDFNELSWKDFKQTAPNRARNIRNAVFREAASFSQTEEADLKQKIHTLYLNYYKTYDDDDELKEKILALIQAE